MEGHDANEKGKCGSLQCFYEDVGVWTSGFADKVVTDPKRKKGKDVIESPRADSGLQQTLHGGKSQSIAQSMP